jgi:hypothetical protein
MLQVYIVILGVTHLETVLGVRLFKAEWALASGRLSCHNSEQGSSHQRCWQGGHLTQYGVFFPFSFLTCFLSSSFVLFLG